MEESRIIADWLRQREGEPDADWIVRLQTLFQTDVTTDDPKADRIGERLMARFLSRQITSQSGE